MWKSWDCAISQPSSQLCDTLKCHMKQASLRDLRYHFDRIATLLQEGEEIQITKRKRVIARLLPPSPPAKVPRPDFAARLKQMWGDKVMEVSGAELLAQERSSRD